MPTNRTIADALKEESPAFRVLLVLLFVNMLVSGAALWRVSQVEATSSLTCNGSIVADVTTSTRSSYIGGDFRLSYSSYVPDSISGNVSLECN
jgi:hypothetical protein